MKTEWDIAQAAADAIYRMAHASGYEARAGRAIFIHSDLLDLAHEISQWLIDHMQPESEEE